MASASEGIARAYFPSTSRRHGTRSCNMRIYHIKALLLLIFFLTQTKRVRSENGQSAGNSGTEAGFGMAKLSGGGMIMIMTCFELRNREETNGGDSLGETFKKVTSEGNFLAKSSFFHHPLASEEQVDSTESVV